MSKKNKSIKPDEQKQPEKTSADNAVLVKIQGVIERLPYLECIYVNEKGDYHLQPMDGFSKFTRDQILDMEPGEAVEPEADAEIPDNKSGVGGLIGGLPAVTDSNVTATTNDGTAAIQF